MLVLAVALFLALILSAGIWKGKSREGPKATAPASESPDGSEAEMKISDMDYSEMEGGRCSWTLSATEAQYYQKDQVSMLQSVRLKFFLKDGGIIHLSSDRGKLYAGSKNIELRGSVFAILPDGYELRTETADYDHALKTITSKDPISMRSREVSLDGTGWLYKIQEGRALVEKGVKATLCANTQATDGANPGPTAGCGQ